MIVDSDIQLPPASTSKQDKLSHSEAGAESSSVISVPIRKTKKTNNDDKV